MIIFKRYKHHHFITFVIAPQDLSHFARIASFLCQHAESQFGVPCPAGSVGSSGMLAEIEEHSETGPIAEVDTQY